ncbi:OmpA family protein [Aliidiomarina maris]|uniref:OOP family OmpA-OmpF porin n=1 Tax=Aliidiomarina maris TaxID=531312 RepID=A0A327WY21_9GAMM|nr:OmpA family protein [Aliidiomarina maris]MBA3988628.1 OprF [Idiomarina sp.]RAJ96559.1 OOP family OmpA-OmpF porin [Aliidiomarina maris]RUO23696.1 OprF [Aliidiomarina maris]
MRTLFVKTTAISAAVLMGLASTAALAQSQSDEHTYFGVRLGLANSDSDRFINIGGTAFDYDSGFAHTAYGLQLGHRFGNGWEIRSYYDRLRTDVVGASNDSGYMFGADGLYNFRNGIYLGAGINSTEYNNESDRFLRGTVGYSLPFADRWNARVEYAYQTSSDFDDQYLGLSLNYAFGMASTRTEARQEPTQTAPTQDQTRDSDGDGVPDYRDQCPNTPRGHVVDDEGCSVMVEQNIRHELVVNFAFDSSDVQSRFYGDIEELAQMMREHSDVSIEIGGHTDLIGPADYNQNLSERRAQAVKDVLVNRFNISADRISTRGYGMRRPVVDEVSLEANPRNRRIEATLSTTEEVPLTREMQRRGY